MNKPSLSSQVIPGSLNRLQGLKQCSACAASVERGKCHKNRHGEYICRSCQAAGVTVTFRRRVKILAKKIDRIFWKITFYAGAFLVVVWFLWRTFDQVGSPPPQASAAYHLSTA